MPVDYVVQSFLILFLTLLESLVSPLWSFTYPDDHPLLRYLFPTLIITSLVAIIARHLCRPYPEWWLRCATVLAWICALLPGLAPLTMLFYASWEARKIVGHWPQWMLDDPKIVFNDAVYDVVSDNLGFGFCVSGWATFTFTALMIHLTRQLPAAHLRWLLRAYAIGWLILAIEPSRRYGWWMD
jgi:hypothetical protein